MKKGGYRLWLVSIFIVWLLVCSVSLYFLNQFWSFLFSFKNTVYLIFKYNGVRWSESRSVMSDSSQPHGLYSPRNSPGQNTGVGSLSLLQGIFPTQGSNPGFPHCRRIVHQLSHLGSLRILKWVAYLFSSGSSWPRNRTWVSCIAGGFCETVSYFPLILQNLV